MGYIDASAKITNTLTPDDVRIYKNVDIRECQISNKCIIGDLCRIEKSSLGYQTQMYPNGIMYGSSLGDYSYVQKNGSIWHTNIGKFCSISWNVSIGGGDHDFHKVTSHSILYATSYGFVDEPLYDRFAKPCSIGNDVWIGAGASILRGVKIGDGAVIGAGAVVTKDVEPYSIVAGVPAKKIGQRCDDRLIEKMLELKWWDWSFEQIKKNIDLFNLEISEGTVQQLLREKEQQNN